MSGKSAGRADPKCGLRVKGQGCGSRVKSLAGHTLGDQFNNYEYFQLQFLKVSPNFIYGPWVDHRPQKLFEPLP